MKKIFKNLFNSEKNIVGLDIGISSIKVMEISGETLEDAKLERYAVVDVPLELIDEGGDFKKDSLEKVSELVVKCFKKAGINSQNVTICMKGNNVITKKAIIPMFTDEEDLKNAVETELIKYIPAELSLQDLAIDYFVLGPNEINPSENDMLLIASKKDRIEELQAIVEGANLIPEILDIEVYAFQNLLRLMIGSDFETGNYVLADCSGRMLKIFVFMGGQLIGTRESLIGGINLTHDIMNNLNISFLDAEKMKFSRTGDETYDLIEKSFINNYKNEFLSLLTYFTSTTSLGEVDQVILAGGVAGTPYLLQAITEGLLENPEILVKTEPYIARPLDNAEKSSKIDLPTLSRDEPGLFLVTSLAIRKYLRQF